MTELSSFTWPPFQANMASHDQPTWARMEMTELPYRHQKNGRKASRSQWANCSPLGKGQSEQLRFHLRWGTKRRRKRAYPHRMGLQLCRGNERRGPRMEKTVLAVQSREAWKFV